MNCGTPQPTLTRNVTQAYAGPRAYTQPRPMMQNGQEQYRKEWGTFPADQNSRPRQRDEVLAFQDFRQRRRNEDFDYPDFRQRRLEDDFTYEDFRQRRQQDNFTRQDFRQSRDQDDFARQDFHQRRHQDELPLQDFRQRRHEDDFSRQNFRQRRDQNDFTRQDFHQRRREYDFPYQNSRPLEENFRQRHHEVDVNVQKRRRQEFVGIQSFPKRRRGEVDVVQNGRKRVREEGAPIALEKRSTIPQRSALDHSRPTTSGQIEHLSSSQDSDGDDECNGETKKRRYSEYTLVGTFQSLSDAENALKDLMSFSRSSLGSVSKCGKISYR